MSEEWLYQGSKYNKVYCKSGSVMIIDSVLCDVDTKLHGIKRDYDKIISLSIAEYMVSDP